MQNAKVSENKVSQKLQPLPHSPMHPPKFEALDFVHRYDIIIIIWPQIFDTSASTNFNMGYVSFYNSLLRLK